MTIIEQIKAEIERLKEDVPCRYHPYSCASVLEAYEELLSFLSTLESEKPMNPSGSSEIPKELKEASEKEYPCDKSWMTDSMLDMNAHCQVAFWKGAKWQKEQMMEEWLKDRDGCFWDGVNEGKKAMKEQMMKEDYPKWRRIKAGERLPCPAYVWTIAYDNYPDCFEGRLMPNIQGVKVGRDTWYLPVDVIHNLPKED